MHFFIMKTDIVVGVFVTYLYKSAIYVKLYHHSVIKNLTSKKNVQNSNIVFHFKHSHEQNLQFIHIKNVHFCDFPNRCKKNKKNNNNNDHLNK